MVEVVVEVDVVVEVEVEVVEVVAQRPTWSMPEMCIAMSASRYRFFSRIQ